MLSRNLMAPKLLSGAAGPLRELPVSRILSRMVRSRDDHSSRRDITDALNSDLPGGCGDYLTRLSAPDRHATTAWVWPRIPSLFGLAPCGVYPAPGFTAGAVRSYRTFSPLPAPVSSIARRRGSRRYLLCGTCRLQALTPESRTLSGTLSCGVRTFLPRNEFRQRSSGNPAVLKFNSLGRSPARGQRGLTYKDHPPFARSSIDRRGRHASVRVFLSRHKMLRRSVRKQRRRYQHPTRG